MPQKYPCWKICEYPQDYELNTSGKPDARKAGTSGLEGGTRKPTGMIQQGGGCLPYDVGVLYIFKETLDQPDPIWLQFRRLDKLEPFCRVAGHTSEEVREILAPWKRCTVNSFRSSTCANGEAPSTPGSHSRSSTRPILAA
jgi:hypothetical protein